MQRRKLASGGGVGAKTRVRGRVFLAGREGTISGFVTYLSQAQFSALILQFEKARRASIYGGVQPERLELSTF
jgi:hypothetical protein